MLKTRLTGEIIPDFDVKITEFLEKSKFKQTDGHTMIIGIDNHKDKMYRIIEVTGLDDFVLAAEFLESLNLLDVLELGIRIRSKGCDMRLRQFESMDINDFRHKLVTGRN